MRIYIAGPYSAASDVRIRANVTAAIDAGIELAKRGWAPFIPHLTHWVALRVRERAQNGLNEPPSEPELKYEDYLRMDDAFLAVCDAFLFLGSSPGADKELALAKKMGLTIYGLIDDVPSI